LTQLYNVNNNQNVHHRHSLLSGGPEVGSPSHRVVSAPPPAIPNAVVDPKYNFVTEYGIPLTAVTQKRKKGFFSSSKLLHKEKERAVGPAAWIAGQAQKLPYDLALLASGVKVSYCNTLFD
jgi:hypothetical protein